MPDRTGKVVHNATDRYHWFDSNCHAKCVIVTDDEAVTWIWGRTND